MGVVRVDKSTAAKAATVLAVSAAVLILAAVLLTLVGPRNNGASVTPTDYDRIESEARQRARRTMEGEGRPADGDDASGLYLDAIAARLALATDIPLDPPPLDEEQDPQEAGAEQPTLTPEEAARRRAERERALLEQQPSLFRYLGRIRLGGRSVALLACEAGQTAVAEGGTTRLTVNEQNVGLKIVSVEDDRVVLYEAVTDGAERVDIERVGIRRTLERAARRNSIIAGNDRDPGPGPGGSAGSATPRARRAAELQQRRARSPRDDSVDLSDAEQQRRLRALERLRGLGFTPRGALNARDLRTVEGLMNNLERAQQNRPDPRAFEGGASSEEYREQFGNWNRGVENLRQRIRETIGGG